MREIELLEQHIKETETQFFNSFELASRLYTEGDEENHKIWYHKMIEYERRLGHLHSNYMDIMRSRK